MKGFDILMDVVPKVRYDFDFFFVNVLKLSFLMDLISLWFSFLFKIESMAVWNFCCLIGLCVTSRQTETLVFVVP